MAELITLQIDGKEVKTTKGATVLKAAQEAGIYVPTLCADEDLEPYGGCRLCVVEIDGVRGQPTSCTTPAADSMVVRTQTPAVEKIRKTAVELMLSDHPMDCLICVKNQRCDLQKVAAYVGIDQYRFKHTTRAVQLDSSSRFFERNLNKCILCAKCARVCGEVRGVGAVDVAFRGFSSVITAFGNRPIFYSNCISCGACVSKCPVGALYLKDDMRPDAEIRTVCPYCSVGCGVKLGVRRGKIVSVWPERENESNHGYLCVRGHFGIKDVVQSPDRITSPLIRQGNNYIKATWNEALDLVAARLGSYTKDQVGVISSSELTNEDNYVAQKFARVALGSNNIDQGGRASCAGSDSAMQAALGSNAATNPTRELGDAACILAVGTDAFISHPVLAMQLWRAAHQEKKLVLISSEPNDLVRWAGTWFQTKPGAEAALLLGMARIIVDEGMEDKEFIAAQTDNYADFKKALREYSLDSVESLTGIPKERIAAAARMYASSKPAAIVYGEGLAGSADSVSAAVNLALLTGNLGKTSAGVYPLRGQNNVQGACDAGALPGAYPGYQPVADANCRARFEDSWGVPLNPAPGLNLAGMMEAAGAKKIKALYILGENLALSDPDVRRTLAGSLEFLVVQDVFLTETARLAHVVLPGTTFAEKDGSFTNVERRVQRIRKAIEPAGDSRPDWWIISNIAKRMKAPGFDFETPSAIMDEIAKLSPAYAGISYGRLEKGGLQWPCPAKDHPGTPVLHGHGFSRGKGRFQPLKSGQPSGLADRKDSRNNRTGSMTGKVNGLLRPKDRETLVEPAAAKKV